jgi:hypothetical protein
VPSAVKTCVDINPPPPQTEGQDGQAAPAGSLAAIVSMTAITRETPVFRMCFLLNMLSSCF